jgi:regulatory protein
MRPVRFRKQVAAEKAGDARAVRVAAIALLARRDFASVELSRRLESHGYDLGVVRASVAALASERLVDDARFCENYVAYHANRGQGPARIGADLKALGLSGELIASALVVITDWRARAQAARSRRFGPEAPESWPEKGRQARFLQYRGFSADHIRAALGTDLNLDD